MLIHKETRAEILRLFGEYYAAGHIVGINADVLAHKFADRLEFDSPPIAEVDAKTFTTIDSRDTPQKVVYAKYAEELYGRMITVIGSRESAIAQRDALRADNERLREALAAVLAEVTPGIRPHSTDSYLPEHIVAEASAALERGRT